MVAATANPLASHAALEMLRDGGSALDAAIAAQMVLTAVEPNASGIGGGAMILVAEGEAVAAYDGLSAAPGLVTDRLAKDFDGRIVPADRAALGGRTVGVPGVLRALELAHARHGALPWARLFEPAIALCEAGYPLSPYLLRAMQEGPGIKVETMARALFMEGGRMRPAGSLVRNPALTQTLRRIAEDGADAFYLGEIARDICRVVGGDLFPGTITEADLAAYRAVQRQPVRYQHGMASRPSGRLSQPRKSISWSRPAASPLPIAPPMPATRTITPSMSRRCSTPPIATPVPASSTRLGAAGRCAPGRMAA